MLLLLGAGVVTLVEVARATAHERALARVPRALIADADGRDLVRIEGTVETSAEPLTAPLSGRPCAYWRVEVDTVRRGGANIREESGQEVCVRDASGVVAVDLGRARIEGGARFDARTGDGPLGTSSRFAAFLRAHGFGKRLLWTVEGREFIVAAGARVACAGRVRQAARDAGGGDPYRGDPYASQPYRLVLEPSPALGLLVLADD